jgi:hypothetical protein
LKFNCKPLSRLTACVWAWQGLRPHPDKIAETNSLSSVPLPKLPYKMSLPGHVLLGVRVSLWYLAFRASDCCKHGAVLREPTVLTRQARPPPSAHVHVHKLCLP